MSSNYFICKTLYLWDKFIIYKATDFILLCRKICKLTGKSIWHNHLCIFCWFSHVFSCVHNFFIWQPGQKWC